MKRIGIISDTHSTFDDTLRDFLRDVDEIWHAGDIGSLETADLIASFNRCVPSRATSTEGFSAVPSPTCSPSTAKGSGC